MANEDKRLGRHWKTIRKSKSNPDHLSHAHLYDSVASEAKQVDVYHSPILTISDVSIGLVKSQEQPNGEELVFLHFAGRKEKLGLNSTNSNTLESLSGSPTPLRWAGLTIQLYVDPKAKYPKGKMGPAIRIKPMLPKGAPTPMPEPRAEDVERLESAQEENLEQGREPGQD